MGRAGALRNGRLGGGSPRASTTRFLMDEARRKTAADLHALYTKVHSQVGAKEAAIFRVHESILEDPSFIGKIRCSARVLWQTARDPRRAYA